MTTTTTLNYRRRVANIKKWGLTTLLGAAFITTASIGNSAPSGPNWAEKAHNVGVNFDTRLKGEIDRGRKPQRALEIALTACRRAIPEANSYRLYNYNSEAAQGIVIMSWDPELGKRTGVKRDSAICSWQPTSSGVVI